jgi:2-polyprenyl-6-methoxyphenol hydroxylase-like FAD-dependent oxidoreductase
MSGNNMTYDAVIVGAGIGGGALATVLARAGKSVLVLEKMTVHRDRVRGEWIGQWGVAELKTLGLYDDFIAAGGHHLTRHISYGDHNTPEEAEAAPLPMDALVPGIPGPMTIGHPTQCNLLDELAVKAGATLLRGVEDFRLTAGPSPCVVYSHEGAWHEAHARIIVGADGRGSNIRQQLGIELHQDPQHHWFSGMLVENAHGFPDDLQAIGAEGDTHYLVFPQGEGRARLYIGFPTDQPQRFAGDGAQQRFLDAFRLKCLPYADAIANATPAGPCHSYPNQDAWTDTPYTQGAVLIGDAAGYNDPIIGQGLSITYRDVRIVRDILLGNDDWSDPAIFAPYAEERRERMRRLRFAAKVQSRVENEFGPEGEAARKRAYANRAADPTLMLPALATMVGPDAVPAVAFEDALLEKLFA